MQACEDWEVGRNQIVMNTTGKNSDGFACTLEDLLDQNGN